MNDCQKVRPQLVAFLLGEVSEQESARLAEHVRVCAACQEELAALNLTIELLRRLPREDVSADFDRTLAERISEHTSGSCGNPGRRRHWPPWAGLAAGVALALLVLVPFARHASRPDPRHAPATPQQPNRERPAPANVSPAGADVHAAPASPQAPRHARPSPRVPSSTRAAVPNRARPPVVGRVLRVSGTPQACPGKGQHPGPVRKGMALRAGAVVTTGDTGQAEVEISGGSRVRVDFDTSVTFAAAPGRKAEDPVRLSAGSLYLLVPRSERGLVVQTPHARVEALGPVSVVSVVAADRRDRGGPGLHLELTGLTKATALRGRLRLASHYGSVIVDEGASAEAAGTTAPSLLPGIAHLQSVRLRAPWGETFFEVWVAERLEPREALKWIAAGDSEALVVGNELLAAGRIGEARQEYEAVVAEQPGNAAALSNLGLARELEGDMEGALAAYHQATEVAPGVAYGEHNLGMAYLRIGNLDRACEHLKAAYQVAPEAVGRELGRTLALAGDYEQAGRVADALRASPATAAQGLWLHGEILRLQGQMAESERWYLLAAQQDPSFVNAPTSLGAIYFLEGDIGQATEWTERALALEPDSLRALNRLGLILTHQGRLKEAEVVLLQAEEAHPDSGIVLHNLGEAYLRAGEVPAAVSARRRAVSLAPDSVLCHMGLAIALEASGALSEARSEYDTTLSLDPTYDEAARRLAALLERIGEPSAANRVLAQVEQYLP